jgi:hypothetical protein
MTKPFPFQRLLVANPQPHPDVDLLRYAAMLASFTSEPEVVIASPAGEPVMRSLAPLSRCVFAAPRETNLSFRILLEPSLDLVFDLAVERQSDLIVTRHPRHAPQSDVLLRQLLFDSPCSVCLVPDGSRTSLERPILRAETTPRGAKLLSLAAAACPGADVIAANMYFHYGLNSAPETIEQIREQRLLEMYRFLARADILGVNCTPLVEESPRQAEALLGLAERYECDLVIVDPVPDAAPVWQWNRRQVESVARMARVPLLSARLEPRSGLLGYLREQVFCEMEPMFN